MPITKRMGIAQIAVVSALAMFFSGCNLAPENTFDPILLQKNERSTAGDVPMPALNPLPATRVDPYGVSADSQNGEVTNKPATGPSGDEPVLRMSLRELIQRMVANNHDVKVAGYQPAIEGTRVTENAANFDPTYFANFQYQHKNELNGGNIFNTFNGLGLITSNVLESDTTQFQTGLQQNLESGGQVQLQYETGSTWLSPQQSQTNPFYESDITLQLTQPLLRNFGYNVNQARIVIARFTQKISLQEFRKTIEQNASDLEQAYWQLMQQQRNIQIQENLLDESKLEFDRLSDRARQGLDVSDLQVQQAASALERRRGQLITFKAQARDLSDKIKEIVSDPDFPVSSPIMILPADDPIEQPMVFDPLDQMNTAMVNRFDLIEQQYQINEDEVTEVVGRNNLLPELDFTGSVGPQGAAASEGGAIQSNFGGNHIDASVGFKLQIPLGNRAARSILERTIYTRLKDIEKYRSVIQTVSFDVKTAERAVKTTWDQIDTARRARYDAQRALDDLIEREKANIPLTPEFVQLKLDREDELAAAQQSEAQALANYNISLAQLEKAKGTLLRYNNVVMEEDTLHYNEMGLLH